MERKGISIVIIAVILALIACEGSDEEWNDKGVALYKTGNYAEAVKCYDKSIEINPNVTV